MQELVQHVKGQCIHDGRQGMCGEGIKDSSCLFSFAVTICERAFEDPAFSDIYALVCRTIEPFCPTIENVVRYLMQSTQALLITLCRHLRISEAAW